MTRAFNRACSETVSETFYLHILVGNLRFDGRTEEIFQEIARTEVEIVVVFVRLRTSCMIVLVLFLSVLLMCSWEQQIIRLHSHLETCLTDKRILVFMLFGLFCLRFQLISKARKKE